jgi:superoxide dismutase, Fe-Mn family
MTLKLPELPYAKDALEPHISAETLDFHHGKHHNAYVVNGNKLLEGTEFFNKDMVEIIQATAGDMSKAGIFNNVAQVWNHNFYWNSMSPNGGGQPTGELMDRIAKDFGSYEDFRSAFTAAGATQFGSGWAWLIEENGDLKITKTANADNPLTKGQKPLLTMDVWEHAYYVDFRNARPKYMETFLDHLVNWEFATANMSA